MNSFDIALASLVDAAIKEDIGNGDHSTLSCIPASQQGKAQLKIKERGILAGVEVAKKIFTLLEPNCHFIAFKKDGDQMIVGEIAFEINDYWPTI